MCEFKVILKGEIVFKDVVHVVVNGNNVVVRDVLGRSREFRNCRIKEIDVNSTRLVLDSA
jgi:predicted RNA-binding protein